MEKNRFFESVTVEDPFKDVKTILHNNYCEQLLKNWQKIII